MNAERYPYSSAERSVAYLKYGLWFILVYIIAIVAIAAVSLIFKISVPAFVSVIMTMIGGMVIGQKFYKDQGRVPEKSEKRRLALTGVAGGLVVSILPLLILIAYDDPSLEPIKGMLQIPAGIAIMTAAILFTLGITYLMIGLGIKQGVEIQRKADTKSR